MQAFCMTELQVLCIDCLIQEQEKHKQHEILGLEDAAKIERSKILMQTRNSEKKEEDIRNNILNLKSHLMILEEQSRHKRAQTSQLFEQIRQKILDRETALLKSISENLEQETQHHRRLIGQYERQMKHI